MNYFSTNRITTIRSNLLNRKTKDNFYLIERAFMIWKANKNWGSWYLDFCTSKHIYNKRKYFSSFYLKNYKFVIANRDTIRLEKIGMIKLILLNKLDTILSNIAFALRFDLNLISFRQLKEVEILNHAYSKVIIIKKIELSLVQYKKEDPLYFWLIK